MQWMSGQSALFAYGRADGYLVTRDETGVRLARFSIARVDAGLSAAVAAEAVRSAIIFPLGRGPGRPGGEPELDALAESAKMFAEKYEAGEDLDGYPEWQRTEYRTESGHVLTAGELDGYADEAERGYDVGQLRNVTKNAPPHLMGPDLRPVQAVAPGHEAHTVDGPPSCSRCQLLRDNQDWMTP